MTFQEIFTREPSSDFTTSYSSSSKNIQGAKSDRPFFNSRVFHTYPDEYEVIKNKIVKYSLATNTISTRYITGYPGTGVLHGFKGWIKEPWSKSEISSELMNDLLINENRN